MEVDWDANDVDAIRRKHPRNKPSGRSGDINVANITKTAMTRCCREQCGYAECVGKKGMGSCEPGVKGYRTMQHTKG